MIDRKYENPVQLLANLAYTLDNAFISDWQTVVWDKELKEALEYLEQLDWKNG